MNTNVGSTDQIVRLLAGILLLGTFFVLEGNARWLALIGGVLIGTAVFRWCPIYTVLRMNTQSSKPAPDSKLAKDKSM